MINFDHHQTEELLWKEAIANLHKISTEEVDSYVDQCHKKYGNLLTSEQQRNYIRAAIEADHPFQYFQFTGRVFRFRRNNLFWLPDVPRWFRKFYRDGKCEIYEHIHTSNMNQLDYIYFLFSEKKGCDKDDYIVNIDTYGIMAIPKEVFEKYYNKDEIKLYKYCEIQHRTNTIYGRLLW